MSAILVTFPSAPKVSQDAIKEVNVVCYFKYMLFSAKTVLEVIFCVKITKIVKIHSLSLFL